MDPRQYLEETHLAFRELYASLSKEQLQEPGPDGAWSGAEFAEHLAAAERGIGILLKRGLGAAVASAEDLAATAGKTELILSRVASAAGRAQSPESMRPNGRYGEWPGALEALAEARATTIGLAEADGLETFVAPHPALGPMTGTQWLLFCAAHMERHRRQLADRLGR
jgi:hypothetical protein